LLFAATMAGEVADFVRTHLHDPVRVEVVRSGATAERAIQQVFLIGETEKTALLMALLEQDDLSTLVFAPPGVARTGSRRRWGAPGMRWR